MINNDLTFHATTIVAVKKEGMSAMAGDGQVTMGESTVIKHSAVKVRRIYNEKVLVGFAGSVADAFALSDKFEAKLELYAGNLNRAAVELAKEWRTDKALRKLEALLIAMDKEHILLVSGTGEVIAPDDDVIAIGSGGMYALAAAKALKQYSDLNAEQLAYEALKIASDICVYTNHNIKVETL
jgi:ATP-dependent HslUV protease subunit HslV